jgi:hypothetical protein
VLRPPESRPCCAVVSLFHSDLTVARVQAVLAGHNGPPYSKQEVAFRDQLDCALDGYMLTPDVQKEKYVYCRCIAHRLGKPLRSPQVLLEVAVQIITALDGDQKQAQGKGSAERTRLKLRLSSVDAVNASPHYRYPFGMSQIKTNGRP